jgi:hypothetical protein
LVAQEIFMRAPIWLSIILPLAACGQQTPTADNVTVNAARSPAEMTAIPEDTDSLASAPDASATDATAAWIGRWTGPEGLFLDIQHAGSAAGQYALTIKDNLDTQGEYAGTAKDDAIIFTRNGKAERIRAGTGDETGFKYLAGKKDCLIVQAGKEGYCR